MPLRQPQITRRICGPRAARAGTQVPRGAAGRTGRPHRLDRGQGGDPPAGGGAADRGPADQGRPGRAHHHPAPGVRGQPRHRKDHGGPAGRRHLSGPRAAQQGPTGRGRPLRTGGRVPRSDRHEDRRGGRLGRGRGAVHRRGLQSRRRPVRDRGRRHLGQGDGGPPRRPGADRGRLSGSDGDLHRPESGTGQPVPHHDRVRRLLRHRAGRDLPRPGHQRRLRRDRGLPAPLRDRARRHPARSDLRQRPVRAEPARGGDRATRLAAPRRRGADPAAAARADRRRPGGAGRRREPTADITGRRLGHRSGSRPRRPGQPGGSRPRLVSRHRPSPSPTPRRLRRLADGPDRRWASPSACWPPSPSCCWRPRSAGRVGPPPS